MTSPYNLRQNPKKSFKALNDSHIDDESLSDTEDSLNIQPLNQSDLNDNTQLNTQNSEPDEEAILNIVIGETSSTDNQAHTPVTTLPEEQIHPSHHSEESDNRPTKSSQMDTQKEGNNPIEEILKLMNTQHIQMINLNTQLRNLKSDMNSQLGDLRTQMNTQHIDLNTKIDTQHNQLIDLDSKLDHQIEKLRSELKTNIQIEIEPVRKEIQQLASKMTTLGNKISKQHLDFKLEVEPSTKDLCPENENKQPQNDPSTENEANSPLTYPKSTEKSNPNEIPKSDYHDSFENSVPKEIPNERSDDIENKPRQNQTDVFEIKTRVVKELQDGQLRKKKMRGNKENRRTDWTRPLRRRRNRQSRHSNRCGKEGQTTPEEPRRNHDDSRSISFPLSHITKHLITATATPHNLKQLSYQYHFMPG